MKRLIRIFAVLFSLATIVAGFAALAVWLAYEHYSQGLPDYYQLAAYDPPVTTRVYAGDGRLLAEYSVENRVFVPIKAIPKRVINAFLAAEDKTFYTHPGIDVPGLVGAVIANLRNYGTDRRPVGASTITQQVTKNFLLTNEVSVARKVKEAILALRIEKAFTKDRILELYLNQIYLGAGNYGVAAAALNYFNKSLDELSVAEAAYLAALPKAPNNYSIARHPQAAKERRDWVIGRMLEDGHVGPDEALLAIAEPLQQLSRKPTERYAADYFAEEVRRELVERFGEDGLYKKGLTVKATIDPKLQEVADRVLRRHLVAFDRTQGYRGPLGHVDDIGDWLGALAKLEPMPWLYDWLVAIVLGLDKAGAELGFRDASRGRVALSDLSWARRVGADGKRGPAIARTSDVFAVGDVIAVEPKPAEGDLADKVEEITSLEEAAAANAAPAAQREFLLRQVPQISGAMVVMDPHTGRVLAMTGGWSYRQSEFNRATQAKRQLGSSFKPIVYLAALEAGYSPSTIILDAPMVIDQGPGLPLWKPENYKQEYFGPSTMRLGLEKSRNLMTIRLAQTVGMAKVAEVAERMGVVDKLQQTLAMSLGAQESTVLRIVGAYAEIVNGGKKVTPAFIDRVQDAQGWTVFRHDERPCDDCQGQPYAGQPPPELPDTRPQVLDPGNAYQMVSMMEGVVQRGTGVAVKVVGKPLAGKTGTTNDGRDVWFVGFSPDLVAGVYLGFDQPRSLGEKATGGRLSAPIFRDFMIEALRDKPATPFRVPPGLRMVKVDLHSGLRWQPDMEGPPIWEAFKPGTEPMIGESGERTIIEGFSDFGADAGYGSVIPLGGAGEGGTTIIDSTGVRVNPGVSELGLPATEIPLGNAAPEIPPAPQEQSGQEQPGQIQPGEQPLPVVPPPLPPMAPDSGNGNAGDSGGGLY